MSLRGERGDGRGTDLDRADQPLRQGLLEGLSIWSKLGQSFRFATVDEEVAQRWEVTSQQLLEQSLANLRARAASIDPTQVINGVLSGHSVRILRDHPRWASSVILDEPALFRLFGTHDQILATPTRRSLISLPILTPSWVVADIVVDLEVGQLRALMLDAFVIEDRRIVWGGDGEWGDELD